MTAAVVSGTIGMVTGMVATRAGAHWTFSQKECSDIGQAVTKILDRYDLTEFMGKYGDWVGLITAVGTAVVPRVMHSVMNKPAQPKGGTKSNVEPIRKQQQQPAPSPNTHAAAGNQPSGIDHGGAAAYGTNDTIQLLTGIMG